MSLLATQFSVSVTYLIALSLIVTGPIQLVFTRFVADKTYEKNNAVIIPNLLGVMLIVTVFALLIVMGLWFFIHYVSVLYKFSLGLSFIVMCNLWVVMTLVSGLRSHYGWLLLSFFIGYLMTIVFALILNRFGIEGIVIGFYLGQSILLFSLLLTIFRYYPVRWRMSFEFLKFKHLHYHLILIGLFYNIAIWVDKAVFWFSEHTSQSIIGPLRSSIIYDLPIFFSYLTIITGMSVFLLRMETDFSQACQQYFYSLENYTLSMIKKARYNLYEKIRLGLWDVVKVQSVTCILCILSVEWLFSLLGISLLYVPLFTVLSIAVIFQILYLSLLNVCFYLGFNALAVKMTVFFAISNGIFTYLSSHLETNLFGYGYLLSTVMTSLFGLWGIFRKMPYLEQTVFNRRS